MSTFGIVFLAALGLATAARLWLDARQVAHVRRHRNAVPSEFAGQITLEAHQRAADYTCARTRLAMASTLAEAAIVLWLTFGGALEAMHQLTARGFAGEIGRGIALIALVTLVMSIADLPFSVYRTFRIEERFGFNRMSPGLFVADLAKSLLLAAALGLPLAACVLWLMQASGSLWWIYAWIVWAAFNLLMLAVYPTWIAPLFNRFSPMPESPLKQRVERLLERCGFRVAELMIMDGSRRSSHGNAYFTGFGKAKRIVFFDTLISRLEPGEVEAVLAHELGHFKLRHVAKRLAWLMAASLALFAVLGHVAGAGWFFAGLNVSDASPAMALVLFVLIVPSFTFLLRPIGAMYSRRHEFEADCYAAQHAAADDLISALTKLYRDNASTLTPDPAHSAFHDSHPPALARIERLKSA
jgi:STE24 endopeptidase